MQRRPKMHAGNSLRMLGLVDNSGNCSDMVDIDQGTCKGESRKPVQVLDLHSLNSSVAGMWLNEKLPYPQVSFVPDSLLCRRLKIDDPQVKSFDALS